MARKSLLSSLFLGILGPFLNPHFKLIAVGAAGVNFTHHFKKVTSEGVGKGLVSQHLLASHFLGDLHPLADASRASRGCSRAHGHSSLSDFILTKQIYLSEYYLTNTNSN